LQTNDADQLRIAICAQGDRVHTWNLPDHQLQDTERGVVAYRDEEPIAALVWREYRAHEGPQSWLKQGYVYLQSAWIDPRHRGRDVISALASALRQQHPQGSIHGNGPGATLVAAFINNYDPARAR